MVLLWENPNPASAFANQNVAVDLSDYSFVAIVFLTDRSYPQKTVCYIPVGVDGYFSTQYCVNNKAYYVGRPISTETTRVTFNKGLTTVGTNTGFPLALTANNDCAIPYQIYGIK